MQGFGPGPGEKGVLSRPSGPSAAGRLAGIPHHRQSPGPATVYAVFTFSCNTLLTS
ncbi:hypothetical protein HMPREF9946_02475 [Acetobacteraceae bacterium AT-5844]|nr:hypothetical protein HMPREF9946_02475 [Acetobacteraceae bacterium AT-5844]